MYLNRGAIYGLLGLSGAFITGLFGGWDAGLQSLFMFMAIDYLTGLVVAGVFKKSNADNARIIVLVMPALLFLKRLQEP